MIKIDITARNFEADAKIKAYVGEKINGLEKLLPRAMRDGAYAKIVLTEDVSGREDNRFVCDGVVTVEGKTFQAKEATLNMYAAVDIVEAKLKSQLREFKDKTVKPRRSKSLVNRILRRGTVAELEVSE